MAASEVLLLKTKKVKLRSMSYNVADEEQNHEEDENLSFVAGMLAASVGEMRWTVLLWNPSAAGTAGFATSAKQQLPIR